MPTVNVHHIDNLLVPLSTVTQARYDRIVAIDPLDKASFCAVFAEEVLPVFLGLRPEAKQMLRETLAYALTKRPPALQDMIDGMQDSPVGGIDNPYPMLEALWDVLFPGEDSNLRDLSDYVEQNDASTGNEIFAPDGGWPQ